ncbi:MAG: hypothetical protein ACK4UN_15705, partial [Limisphaerales bacterium]
FADHSSCLSLKESGQLIAAFATLPAFNSGQGAVAQFTLSNAVEWTAKTVTNEAVRRQVRELASDQFGNVYVLTTMTNSANWEGYVALNKYNSNGVPNWQMSHQTGQPSRTRAKMAIDALGNVFVATTSMEAGLTAWEILKILPDGGIAHTSRIGSSTNENFRPHAVRLADCDRVEVAGTVPTLDGSGYDILVLSYPHSPFSITSAGDKIELSFTGQPGTSKKIQASGDLLEWTDYAIVTVDSTGAGALEIIPEGKQKFFRCDCNE